MADVIDGRACTGAAEVDRRTQSRPRVRSDLRARLFVPAGPQEQARVRVVKKAEAGRLQVNFQVGLNGINVEHEMSARIDGHRTDLSIRMKKRAPVDRSMQFRVDLRGVALSQGGVQQIPCHDGWSREECDLTRL
ncbi:hypothetical protein [Microtetraspora malaysiensis]|uniref:hypothetical protein n=1 Tax=Microtetraspora malaysiensis TaxID=161358 RepID=UPI003D8D445D